MRHPTIPTVTTIRWSVVTAFASTLVVIGAVLRITYYALNPPLSSDEAALALNLMHRSYSGLFDQLAVKQAAPPGFLMLQKLAIDAFGPTPYVLRLLPLLASLLALILFYFVAERAIGRRAALFGLGLFAILDALLAYAATNKPYSVDVAVALVIYAIFLRHNDAPDVRRAVTLALVGALAVWLSYPAAFVLAGVGAAMLLQARTARRAQLARIGLLIVVWLASWIGAYAVTYTSVAHLQRSLSGQPGGGGNIAEIAEPGRLQTYGGITRFLLGIPEVGHGPRTALTLVGLALGLVGLVLLLRSRLRTALVLVVPSLIALLASSLHKYALFPRTFLFATPTFVMLTALGAAYLISHRRITVVVVGAAAIALLSASASYAAFARLRSTGDPNVVRALRYLGESARAGDSLYLHVGAQLDYRYYLECGCIGSSEKLRKLRAFWPAEGPLLDDRFMSSDPPQLVAGRSKSTSPDGYAPDLRPVGDRSRVWAVVVDPRADAGKALVRYLAEVGTRGAEYPRSPTGSARVALYDLR